MNTSEFPLFFLADWTHEATASTTTTARPSAGFTSGGRIHHHSSSAAAGPPRSTAVPIPSATHSSTATTTTTTSAQAAWAPTMARPTSRAVFVCRPSHPHPLPPRDSRTTTTTVPPWLLANLDVRSPSTSPPSRLSYSSISALLNDNNDAHAFALDPWPCSPSDAPTHSPPRPPAFLMQFQPTPHDAQAAPVASTLAQPGLLAHASLSLPAAASAAVGSSTGTTHACSSASCSTCTGMRRSSSMGIPRSDPIAIPQARSKSWSQAWQPNAHVVPAPTIARIVPPAAAPPPPPPPPQPLRYPPPLTVSSAAVSPAARLSIASTRRTSVSSTNGAGGSVFEWKSPVESRTRRSSFSDVVLKGEVVPMMMTTISREDGSLRDDDRIAQSDADAVLDDDLMFACD